MRMYDMAQLGALIGGVGSFATAWGHPGHAHSTEPLARLVHTATEWGPLLVVLVIAGAAAWRLWKSARG